MTFTKWELVQIMACSAVIGAGLAALLELAIKWATG